ncbi:MAG: hypothetical protein ACT4PM_09805 [Gemmatimonadales bacterium]
MGSLADYYRWRVGLALGDRRALTRIRSRLDSLSEATLMRMVNVSQLDGLPLEDALRAADALWGRSGVWEQQRLGYVKRAELALNRGNPGEARGLIERWTADHPFRAFDRLSEVVNALYWNADTTLAALAVREIGSRADDPAPATGPAGNAQAAAYDVCAANLWRLFTSGLERVSAAASALRREGQRGFGTQYAVLCAAVRDAHVSAALRRPDLRTRVEELDSLVRGPATNSWILAAANLTAARLWHLLGEPRRALTATRRRAYLTDLNETRVLVAQSAFFREEGRLAAATGDREGAARAYRRYLRLRADPDSALIPQRDSVRAELARLLESAPAR